MQRQQQHEQAVASLLFPHLGCMRVAADEEVKMAADDDDDVDNV
jgi:hypothetical protein